MIGTSVEFRVGEENGEQLKRSIYTDLVNLPDPVKLSLTVRIFNYDDAPLYMRVDGYKTGWTFTENDFGAVANGANIYRHIDEFGSRAKPAAETSETITVRLRAYTDAGYTDLKWTFERVIDVIFIKSDDTSWTEDFLNNFDDGTVQGWAYTAEAGDMDSSQFAVATNYVLSTPYSLYARQFRAPYVAGENRFRISKTFATPNRNTVYAIIEIRFGRGDISYLKYFEVQRDGTVLVHVGRLTDTALSSYLPGGVFPGYTDSRWIRFVVPLPKNESVDVRLVLDWYTSGTGTALADLWIDDFCIISKD